jgi:hypothetical protein
MTAGRARWLAKLKSEGKPNPCGRKKGGRNLPPEEREQIACEKRRRREGRLMLQRVSGRTKGAPYPRAGGGASRKKMEDHARRKARADAGLPYWTPEELENL